MESPIQKDGASQVPANPANEPVRYAEDHPSIHDARSAIMNQAVEEEEARRTTVNAEAGVPVDAAPEPGPDRPAPEDTLDGIRGPEGYVPDRSGQNARPEEGLQDIRPMHEESTPEANDLPEDLQDDPLAEFLVMDEEDQVMFRAKVNGKEELIPLEKARAAIQKHEAADQRLQEVNQWRTSLQQREAVIAAREEDLQTKLQGMHTPAQEVQPSPDADLSDTELEKQAGEVVAGLFTEDQETASAKLVELLKKTRGASATPQVDPEAIAEQAVSAARKQLSDEAVQKDISTGYEKFSAEYKDILADENLFRYADSLTDTIRAEHPDWMPSEVMLESGKRTREWVQSLKPSDDTSEQPNQPTDRRERKRQLRPIPRIRSGKQEPAAQERPETPSSVLADIRASRGQPVA